MKACNQCGKCCIKYSDGGLYANAGEIEQWELFNPEISQYVHQGEIWFDPKTRQRLRYCPFLEVEPRPSTLSTGGLSPATKYTCSIYLNRPDDCRQYPSLVSEMVRDECEMIEIKDLTDTKRAQRELDDLMQDSRSS